MGALMAVTAGPPARRDRRQERHEATRQEILNAAWTMVREEGLAALSLRPLARAVGMEAQSLYTYFPSKYAIYDAMFAEANKELLARRRALAADGDPVELLSRSSQVFVEFCLEDPVRYQLLFQRTIPAFEPSPESYEIAKESLDITRRHLAAIGVTSRRDLDLYTALIAGLLSQQLSNEPGGDRWTRQLRRVREMYLKEVGYDGRTKRVRGKRGGTDGASAVAGWGRAAWAGGVGGVGSGGIEPPTEGL
jgi:AcrR family transcriptional regulator